MQTSLINTLSQSFRYSIARLLIPTALLLPSILNAETTSLFNKDTLLKTVSVQLTQNHKFQFAGFYAAQSQGYYADIGLKVKLKPRLTGTTPLRDVVTGQTDFAVCTGAKLVDYVKGAPIRLLMASFQYSPRVLISHKPVKSLSDFAGKTVMHNGSLQMLTLVKKANAQNSEAIKEVPSSRNVQDFIDGHVDFFATYQTSLPKQLKAQAKEFYIVDPKSFGVQGYGDCIYTSRIKSQVDYFEVADFKDATIKGWKYALENPEKVIDYMLEEYGLQLTAAGVGLEELRQEAKLVLPFVETGMVPIGYIEQSKLELTAAQARDVGMISEKEFKSFQAEDFLISQILLSLTDEEKAYLAENKTLLVGNDFNWPPFDFINDQGEYDGIIADHIKWVGKALGLELKTLTNTPWEQILKDLEAGKLDVVPGAMDTPERRAYLDFTEAYMRFPLVIMSRKDVGFISDLSQLAGEKFAVPKGWYTQEMLETKYPEIETLVVNSLDEGLDAVLKGDADFYLGNIAAINYKLKERNIDSLKAVGSIYDSEFVLTMGVQKGDRVLLSILQKALNAMPEEERQRIYNRWVQIEIIGKPDYSYLIKVILSASVVIAILLLLLFWFQKQRKQQRAYIQQVNELSMATYTNLTNMHIEWVSSSFLKLTDCKKHKILNQSHDVLRHPDVSEQYYQEIYDTVKSGETWQGELRAKKCSGDEYWVDATISPEMKNGKVIGAWTTRTNITDKKRIEELAIRDSLTGVFNRNQFNELFESHIQLVNRRQESFAMAMFDLDDFKKLNDRYGHQAGDQALKAVVKVATQLFANDSDLIFRVGGEEFVILSDSNDIEAFKQQLESFAYQVEALKIPNIDAALSHVTVSIGAVFCNTEESIVQPQSVYSQVDQLLYKAKENGKNQVLIEVYLG